MSRQVESACGEDGGKRGLRVVAWESTKACQLACLHCRAEAQHQRHPLELQKEEIMEVIDEISSLCRPIFIVTGGNPLLREDIFEVCSYADKRGLRVALSPSGSQITAEVVKGMRSAGIERVSISLDGSTAKVHDFFRQKAGCFQETLEALNHLRAGGVSFQINTTVTRYNWTDLGNLYRLILSLDPVVWDLFMFIPTGRGSKEMGLLPPEYETVMAYVHELSLSSALPVKMTCAPQYRRFCRDSPSEARGRRPRAKGCMAADGFCFISHLGEVMGCGYLPLSAGNVRERGFWDIYHHSPLFRDLRDPGLLKGKCGQCQLKSVCGGCRARAYALRDDAWEEDPYCIYQPMKGEGHAGAD
jgi:radical SAM protein with 4Fe4S-binding SPASM domain